MIFFYPRTNRPLNKVNLIQDLKRKGYIYDEDYITKKSKFYKGNGFEIEFLTKRDRSQEPIRKIQSIDVNAECLNLLDILEYHVIVIHSHLGIDIRVPKPEAYIIHKILIHDSRSIHKKEKDLRAIENLSIALFKHENSKHEFLEIYYGLSKKQKKIFHDVCAKK